MSPISLASRVAGVYVAYSYGLWEGQLSKGNSATGSQTVSIVSDRVTLADGSQIRPYAVGTPIIIGKETVTPTAVASGANPSVCLITANFSQIHIAPERVSSGTFGLQEALNDAGISGGVVVVDGAWAQAGGTTAMISAAVLPTHTAIEDLRTSAPGAGGATSIVAGTNVTISPSSGLGAVTINAAAAVTLIQDQILGAPAATVTFSAIAGTFKHLRLYFNGRTDAALTSDQIYLQMNADTGNNYATNLILAANTSVTGAGTQTAKAAFLLIAAASSLANTSGSGVVDLIDYANTTFTKQATAMGSTQNAGSVGIGNNLLVPSNFIWNNTAAITSILIGLTSAGNFVAGTRFTLYGIN